jgi:hypothetical protein
MRHANLCDADAKRLLFLRSAGETGAMAKPDSNTGAALTYSHSPRPASMPVSFHLRGRQLIVDRLGSEQPVPLDQIAEVRLTFEPRSFAQKLYRIRLRLKSGNTVSLHSVNFRSMVFADRQEEAYAAFLRELLPRIARANPQARFVVGRAPFVWGALCVTSAAILAAIAFFVWFAWGEGETTAIVIGVFIAAAGIWQMEPIVRLNRPRDFAPDNPPPEMLGG